MAGGSEALLSIGEVNPLDEDSLQIKLKDKHDEIQSAIDKLCPIT